MTPIQQRDSIRNVRARWLSQYERDPPEKRVGMHGGEPVGLIRERLAALDLETCTVSDVDKAIGVTGWADNECDGCGKSFAVVIRIGQEPDYDARWVDLCVACLTEAAAILSATTPLK